MRKYLSKSIISKESMARYTQTMYTDINVKRRILLLQREFSHMMHAGTSFSSISKEFIFPLKFYNAIFNCVFYISNQEAVLNSKIVCSLFSVCGHHFSICWVFHPCTYFILPNNVIKDTYYWYECLYFDNNEHIFIFRWHLTDILQSITINLRKQLT